MIQTINNNLNKTLMTSDQFCYWLQGYFELGGSTELTIEQINMIKTHLNYVFTHIGQLPLQYQQSYISQSGGVQQLQQQGNIGQQYSEVIVTC